MGIPSYFAHILKNHPDLIRKLQTHIDNLYMDANSILYETYYENPTMTDEEHYMSACRRITEIIADIRPHKCVYIAFDGIAPIAKLKQQRDRRVKSEYLRQMKALITNEPSSSDTIKLTCGTPFMNELEKYLKSYFKAYNETQPHLSIFISSPLEMGEGEHKLFYHIRKNHEYHLTTNTAIYGLDADLIMLCLIHSNVPIWIVREKPHFERNDTSKDMYEFSIQTFKHCIEQQTNSNIHDYVFLCFLLGNDFLPHFPTVNIRTNGISILIDRLKEMKTPIIKHNTIQISAFLEFIRPFAENEPAMLQTELDIRERMERKHRSIDDNYKRLELTPLFERETEMWIDPRKEYWEDRYYECLFHADINIRNVVNSYLTGLHWCWNYYTNGLKGIHPIRDWYYPYDYPPLWRDIVYALEKKQFAIKSQYKPISLTNELQLCYVIPPNYRRKYIPVETYKKVYGDLYDDFDMTKIEFETAFCKFLWEAHPKFTGRHYFPNIYEIHHKLEK